MHEKIEVGGGKKTHFALNVHLFVCEFLACFGPLDICWIQTLALALAFAGSAWTVVTELYCSEPSLHDVAHCVVGVWGLGKSWCWGLGAGLPLLGLGLGLCLGQGLGLGLALGLGLDPGLGLGLGGWGGKHVWKRVWKHVCEFVRGYLCHLTNCVR